MRTFVGQQISAVWLGDHTALYLEIGPLTDVYPNSGRPKAQQAAYFGFRWVLESDAGQEISSAESGSVTRIASALTGHQVAAITVSRLRELTLELASGQSFRSLASHAEEPEWTLYLPSGSCIAVEARSLVLESSGG